MECRPLGTTGDSLSVLGLGTMQMEHLGQPEVNRLVGQAVDSGINLVHVDYNYGGCVEKAAEALRGLGSRGSDVFVIACGHPEDPDRFHMEFEGMFRRLGREQIDLFQLSGVSADDRLQKILAPGGALEIAQRARDAGRTRHIGISSHGDRAFLEKIIRTGYFDSIMVPYNIAGFHTESGGRLPSPGSRDLDPALALAHEEGVGVFAIKVLGGGLFMSPGRTEGLLVHNSPITPAMAIRHVLGNAHITSAVIGMASARDLELNLEVVDEGLGPLRPEETALARSAAEGLLTEHCVRCGHCLPCPEQIDIPEILGLAHRALHYPLEQYRRLAARKWEALLSKPSACSDCGECLPRCPYRLPIPTLMRAVERKVEACWAGDGSGRAEHVAFVD